MFFTVGPTVLNGVYIFPNGDKYGNYTKACTCCS